MKFLIAASLVCLALFGQTQGGSLRGYTYSVPVPHSTYGVPSTPAPLIEIPEVQNADSLPHVDGGVNFSIPSESQQLPVTPVAPTTTPQPELPYLPSGLPVLPERPVVPVVIEEPVPEVNNAYLPPVKSVPETPIVESSLPSEAAVPHIPEIPAAPVAPQPSETYGPPSLPVTPLVSVAVAPEAAAVYGPPTVATEAPSAPQINEIPALPAAPFIPAEPVQVYEGPEQGAAAATPSVPITATPTPSVVYGPPTVIKEVPQIAEIPSLPAAPVTPSTPVHLYEVPAVHATPSAEYGPPATVVNEVPSVSQIAESPAFPAAVQVYEIPSPHVTPSIHAQPTAVYAAPTVFSGVQYVGIPTLPEAHLVHTVPLVEKSSPTLSVPTVSTHTFSIRPIVSQIVNFASSFLPIGSESYADSVPVEVPEASPPEAPVKTGYHYEKPAQEFPTPAPVSAKLPEAVPTAVPAISVDQPAKTLEAIAGPAEGPATSGYHYEKPTKGFPTPVSVGFVSHVQNSASSSSLSSIHVNHHLTLPTTDPASGSADSVVIEPNNPSASGFTFQSVFGNSQETSTGNFNQVSIINHGQPNASPISGFVGVSAPHSVYAVPSF